MARATSLVRRALIAALALAALAGGSAAAGPTATTWSGNFTGFPGTSWQNSWGISGSGQWGFKDLKASGSALDVTYGKGSSANSCTNCPNTGGGQFYQDLAKAGHADLQSATTLYLRYQVRFPSNFDFGKAGKLPGFYSGTPGSESGGNHGNGWSTRFMWRMKSGSSAGEVYVYTPSGDGYGEDIGLGSWKFAADDKAHTIEQSVNRSTGVVTVWYDGAQVLSSKSVTGISGIKFGGVFFSTFFGGHDTSWGPKSTVHAYFSDFSVSTAKS
ncbi:hypothetical protein GCM10010174_84980 [Kutzneria viridogrisea]|uniref:Polysaccharide lyase 14 domain-containing protein n=1 Tax=Kutzneria viridogrisea TaxID=47990 RepID=A0ABR6BVM2_9PSEU|nr:hypothetical protein [Kutzneria viridogrisea]